MLHPLSPTAQDVKGLSDVQLRALVELLCRAELGVSGFGVDGVTAGGDQNAADGGVDVRVAWEGGPTRLGYLRHSPCLIQVKAEVMPRGKILEEMAPGGQLRPALIAAAQQSGSYVIASGHDRCADIRLLARKAAMQEALDRAAVQGLVIEFRDASQLAAWAAQHVGVASWLTASVGRPTAGWRAWGAWSSPEEDETAAFLVDAQARAAFGASDAPLVLIPEAITAVRSALRPERSVVRLVGLSGMGKTRFAQALFDSGVGEAALEKTLAVYGDAGATPEVSPMAMAARLAADGVQAVLVVDNCPADLHRTLTHAVRQSGSRLSLLTLDYDVGPDQPEATTVIRLERAGDGLIEDLLRRRFPMLSSADRIRAARFSEGNARIALVIGASAGAAGSLTALDDQQLLDRLFLAGRRDAHPTLRKIARAASLVYAFDIEVDGDAAEFPTLLRFAGVSEGEFFDGLNELLDRGMAQKRGSQVAVLPQALAARLAKEALQGQSTARLVNIYVKSAPLRLFISFTRRLSLLHESPVAVTLARQMLAPGGRLADFVALSEAELDAFAYMAPLAPQEVLTALERAMEGVRAPELLELFGASRRIIQRLAIQLAYDRSLFLRAARLLGRLVLSEPRDHNRDSARPQFAMLFGLTHSGTLATPAERFALIGQLFATHDDGDAQLGSLALKAALGANDNAYGGGWDFGAHSRTDGWRPRTRAEIDSWATSALGLAVKLSRERPERQALARSLVAETFWRLCMWMQCAEQASGALAELADGAFWPEGWVAVCKVLSSEARPGGGLSAEVVADLRRREQAMAPRTIEDRFQAWAEGRAEGWDDPDGSERATAYDAPFQFAHDLGQAIGADLPGWPAYLPRSVRYTSTSRFWQFGMGLADGAPDVEVLWRELTRLYAAVPAAERSSNVLCGMVCGAAGRDPDQADRWLSAALLDSDLAPELVRLQAAAGPLNPKGAARLEAAARLETVRAGSFRWLCHGRVIEKLASNDLDRLLRTLAEREGGPGEAVDILSTRFHLSQGAPGAQLDPLRVIGRHLLTR